MTCDHRIRSLQPDGSWACLDCGAPYDPAAALAEIDAYMEARRSPR